MKSGSTGLPVASAWCGLADACAARPKARLSVGAGMSRSAGFTLLETLIALTILAMSLQALYQMHGEGIRVSAQIEARIAAQNLAEAVLAESTARKGALPIAGQGRGGGYDWDVTVRPQGEALPTREGANWRLYEVTVEVRWPPRRKYSLTVLKLGPADG